MALTCPDWELQEVSPSRQVFIGKRVATDYAACITNGPSNDATLNEEDETGEKT